jgi:hypothetical protein
MTRTAKSTQEQASLQFSAINAVLAGVGLASIVLGYFLLSQGSKTAAPLLLVLGYVVLLPLAIIL